VCFDLSLADAKDPSALTEKGCLALDSLYSSTIAEQVIYIHVCAQYGVH